MHPVCKTSSNKEFPNHVKDSLFCFSGILAFAKVAKIMQCSTQQSNNSKTIGCQIQKKGVGVTK